MPNKKLPPAKKQEIYFALGGNLVNQIYQVAALISWLESKNSNSRPRIFLYNASPHSYPHILDYFPYENPPAYLLTMPKIRLPQGKGTIIIPGSPMKLRVSGFCQSHIYSSTQRNSLRKIFHLNPTKETEDFLSKYKMKKELVFIHVRRGDYCTLHIELPMTYYVNAAEKMKELHGHESLQFIVFSDDTEFCGNYFKNYENTTVIPSMDPIHTLRIMACCDHAVIANSTFSCWPAYYVTGTVIAPGDKTALKHFNDLLLNHWIVVPKIN